MPKAHNERCRDCKESILELLSALYGSVEVNHDLKLPASLPGYKGADSYVVLKTIYLALQRHRGFADFVKAKTLPRVDFFVPKKALIVEFDESQHFTKPREIALSYYPKRHKCGFSLERWRALCLALDKRDNDPPFRDEQRAWYDSLRDFAPTVLGKGLIVRLYARDQAWCSLDPGDSNDLKKFRSTMGV